MSRFLWFLFTNEIRKRLNVDRETFHGTSEREGPQIYTNSPSTNDTALQHEFYMSILYETRPTQSHS